MGRLSTTECTYLPTYLGGPPPRSVQGLRTPYSPQALRRWLQATHSRAWAISDPPHHTTTTPGRERARARGGQGTEGDTQARGHGRAPSEGQVPIGTGHRKRHNVGAGNHPRARKAQERGPRHRERGHHGGHQDPHAGRAYHDGETSAGAPQADAARIPGGARPKHTPPKHKSDTVRITPAHAHQPPETTQTGWRAHLHGENRLQPQRKLLGTQPRSAPPRPHRQATTPATTRAPPHRHRKRTRARPQHPGLGAGTPRGYGTKAQAPKRGQPHGHLPDPPARAARPGPSEPPTPTRTPQPPANHTPTRTPHHHTGQADLHRPTTAQDEATRHTAPQRATVQRTTTRHPKAQHATARRDATRHRATDHGTADPSLND